MISKKSSANAFRTSFILSLKKYAVHGVILYGLLLPMLFNILEMFHSKYQYLQGIAIGDISEEFVFAFAQFVDRDGVGYCALALGLSGMFLALRLWRFMHVKKTVNVFFSLGISKNSLFWSRFLSGCVLLTVPVVLQFSAVLVGNLLLFGSSPELWSAIVFYGLSFLAIALFSFAMTTLAMCANGASVESFLCGGSLIALPVTLFYFVRYMVEMFLTGSAFEATLTDAAANEYIYGNAFAYKVRFLDFFYPVKNTFARGMRLTALSDTQWNNPAVGYALTYLAAACVVSCVAFWVFKKRRAEKAAFLGQSPGLVAAACFSLSLLLAYPVYFFESQHGGMTHIIYAGAGILFAVYALLLLVLLRSGKKVRRALLPGVAACAVFILACCVFTLDWTGFENRIPEKEDIASVSISIPQFEDGFVVGASIGEIFNGDLQTPQDAAEYIRFFLHYNRRINPRMVQNLTDSKDIDTVLSVHQQLLEAQNEKEVLFCSPVALQYTLTDGRKLTRYYEISTPEIEEILKGYASHTLLAENKKEQLHDYSYDSLVLIAPAASSVSVVGQDMLEQGIADQVRDALVKDIESGALSAVVQSEKAPLGYLSMNNYFTANDGGASSPDVADDNYREFTTFAVEVEMQYDIIFEELTTMQLLHLIEQCVELQIAGLLPVYADMKETLAVLTEYDLLSCFDIIELPECVYLLDSPFVDTTGFDERLVKDMNFLSPCFTASYYFAGHNDGQSCAMPNGTVVTEPTQIKDLMLRSFMYYPVTKAGQVAAFAYAGGVVTYMYIPA